MKPDRYRPMLAQAARAPFNSKDWIFEIKWDGIRAISYVDDEFNIFSRNGKELKHNFPELHELKDLTSKTVLDGEIIVMKEGRADFQTLLERTRTVSSGEIEHLSRESPATYVVFDILEKDGNNLTDLPLMERKKMLKDSVKEGGHVILSIFEEEDGESYYDAALKRGIEGVIAKRKDGRYEPGIRSSSWLKIRKLTSCDSVIFGYTRGEGIRKETFGALILGLYDAGKPVYIGKVGTGFSERALELLSEAFRGLETKQSALDEVKVPEQVTWLQPVLVCEVTYQAVTKDGKLRMPSFCRLRSDKAPFECTFHQIGSVSLREYVSKRNFSLTPEPIGGLNKNEAINFVVQEHHARRLHYDFRLERTGVLKSWAVPKGLPQRTGDKRLAVETEDHPLEYREFEGTIPSGQYGAGTVTIWDKGSYELLVWDEKKIEFILSGGRLKGRYALVRFNKAGPKQWIIIKARD